ncbi:MAG: energy transducer TonB [Flavobacteriales bacterium]|nr:energy transducer TonB [Flavobacteriales bacterium]
MKDTITTLFLFMLFITGVSQDLKFEVQGTYSSPITKEQLHAAKTLIDINPGYPTQWISNYVSVEISATSNGKATKAIGTNEWLSTAQKKMLNTADMGTDVVVDVKYQSKNAANGNMDIRTMSFTVSLIPETQAEYLGGYEKMTTYLKENAINKISASAPKEMTGVVRFFINEAGDIADAQLSQTSGDPKIDKVLLEAINKMPKWRPAQNSNGTSYKHEFEFRVGNGGC